MSIAIRRLVFGVLILFLAFILSGCFTVRYHITINRDKTIDEEIIIAAEKALVSMSMFLDEDVFEELRTGLINDGYRVEEYITGNSEGIRAYKTSPPLDDDDLSFDNELFPMEGKGITVEKGFFSNTYDIDISFQIEDMTVMEKEMISLISPDINFVFTLPVKPQAHNAHMVSADGRTMEWVIDPGRKNSIQVSFKEPLIGSYLLVGIPLLAILVAVLFVVLSRGKNRFKGEAVEIEEGLQCPDCGKSVAGGKKYCSGCGQQMEKPGINEGPVIFSCRHCGNSLSAVDRFCPDCGKPLDDFSGDGE